MAPNKNELYDLIHSEQARRYWQGKDKLELTLLDNIHWEAIKGAMKRMNRMKQQFYNKTYCGDVLSGTARVLMETMAIRCVSKMWTPRDH